MPDGSTTSLLEIMTSLSSTGLSHLSVTQRLSLSKNFLLLSLKTLVRSSHSRKIPRLYLTKSSTSEVFETSNDSTSPHNELRNLCNWLEQPLTQQFLKDLEEIAGNLQARVLLEVPRSREGEILREQSLGEIRGLRHLEEYVTTRKKELETEVEELQHVIQKETVSEI